MVQAGELHREPLLLGPCASTPWTIRQPFIRKRGHRRTRAVRPPIDKTVARSSVASAQSPFRYTARGWEEAVAIVPYDMVTQA